MGNDKDHEHYLNAPPLSDILFPTNFIRLASFLQKKLSALQKPPTQKKKKDEKPVKPISIKTKSKSIYDHRFVKVMKQADFLWETGEEEVKKTESWLTGFSPSIHDFGNCSILTISFDR